MNNEQLDGSEQLEISKQHKSDKSAIKEKAKQSAKKKGLTRADILKFAALVAIIAAFIVLTVLLWPKIMKLTGDGGIDGLVEAIRESGPIGVLILFAMQVLQVVVAFIPGEVVQVSAGILYGPFLGSVIVLAGAFCSTLVVYYMVRKLGAPLVSKMVSSKWQQKLGFVTDSPKLSLVVFILFLIPGLPKDIITYVVALTAIRPIKFFVLSTVARAPGVILSSMAGHMIAEDSWIKLAIIVAVILVVVAIVVFNRDKLFKHLNRLR